MLSVCELPVLSVSVRRMEGRLFGRTESERELQESTKAKALHSCHIERANLTSCFRTSWFGYCSEEHRRFWDCYLRVGITY